MVDAWVGGRTTAATAAAASLRQKNRIIILTVKRGDTRLEAEQQRRFAQPNSSSVPSLSSTTSSKQRKQSYGSDSKILSKHLERVKTAGRRGTKRFVDPCKVFIGNIPYDVDKDQLAAFILNTMGESKMILHRSKVITDWKTDKSKGYGFIEFTDPIYSTVCMDVCSGKMFNGRAITVDQGKKKDQDNPIWLQKWKQKKAAREAAEADLTEEERAIVTGLEEAENDYEADELDVDEDGVAIFGGGGNDEDLELDAKLFGIVAGADDDNEEDDGVFLETTFRDKFEEVDPNLNREQRREAAKRIKRKKLPHKGFG
jgi:nucleolin